MSCTAVIWVIGLSASGKTTLARDTAAHLRENGLRPVLLDGDDIRQGLSKDLGFTQSDRTENIRRIAELARLLSDQGFVPIVSAITPLREQRALAARIVGVQRFIEVHVSTPFEVCVSRDPKGLYQAARSGGVQNMTGFTSEFQPPLQPAFSVDCSAPVKQDVLDALLSAVQRLA